MLSLAPELEHLTIPQGDRLVALGGGSLRGFGYDGAMGVSATNTLERPATGGGRVFSDASPLAPSRLQAS